MTIGREPLPSLWTETRIGDLCDLKNGYAFKPEEWSKTGLPIVRIQNLNNPRAPFNYHDGAVRDRFLIDHGSLLFAWSGTPGTSFGAHIWRGGKAILNQHIFRVDFDERIVSKSYFMLAINTRLTELIDKAHGGVGLRHVTKGVFEDTVVPVPPLAEQHRIVAKIEELFSELDKGIESLTTAREQLKIYRQAVLKHAFEGKLTADWRAKSKGKPQKPEALLYRIREEMQARYNKAVSDWEDAVKQWQSGGERGVRPTKPARPLEPALSEAEDIRDLATLPLGWAYFKVASLCDVVRGGSPRPAGDPRYYGGDIPFLKVADLTRSDGVRLNSHTYTITEAGLDRTRRTPPLTLLISNSGATLGVPKICMFETTFNDGIAAFLGLPTEDLDFHYYFWESKTQFLRSLNQGAAQPNLNTSILGEMALPLCSSDELNEVTKRIAASTSACESVLRDLDRQLAYANVLRQSILRKAFSGQLVPQDPNDEPASVLLERIKAEKERSADNKPKPKKLKAQGAAV